jgi:hypothetical protein
MVLSQGMTLVVPKKANKIGGLSPHFSQSAKCARFKPFGCLMRAWRPAGTTGLEPGAPFLGVCEKCGLTPEGHSFIGWLDLCNQLYHASGHHFGRGYTHRSVGAGWSELVSESAGVIAALKRRDPDHARNLKTHRLRPRRLLAAAMPIAIRASPTRLSTSSSG